MADEVETAPDTPDSVRVAAQARVPQFDPRVGVPQLKNPPTYPAEEAPNRLVVIGDSLSHGFQSGAIYNTDISYPAIIASELGWFDSYRHPVYGGPGGLPINIEYLLRDLEDRYGPDISLWETPFAVVRGRQLLDEIEDYWERGAGSQPTRLTRGINHDLAVYGWDLRDALEITAAKCRAALKGAKDDFIKQIVEYNGELAALNVYPTGPADDETLTLFGAAKRLGAEQKFKGRECGIETLIVFLGANNALRSVTDLSVRWSGDDYRKLAVKNAYTVWQPPHFIAEFKLVQEQVDKIGARHVIWCTVPHVTIVPIARGIGGKLRPGSRYFPYYARPWVETADFDPKQDANITGAQARAVDSAIDQYNVYIESVVQSGRKAGKDWYLLDVAGVLDRLASRRYVEDPLARPAWWSPYDLAPAVKALDPTPDSRFLTADGKGGRASGGLFSLDGVHPTTVGYGLMAQEFINIMQTAGVTFRHSVDQSPRVGPVMVDFRRLIARDTLVRRPPQNLTGGLKTIGWADQRLDIVKRALSFRA